MNFKGKKNLITNNFNSIIITEKFNGLNCNISSKKKQCYDVDMEFKKDLDASTIDSEYFLKIVSYFLKNNTILSINQGVKLPRRYKYYTQICSKDKEMSFYMEMNDNNIQKALKSILEKFNADRNLFMMESFKDAKSIVISPNLQGSSISYEDGCIIIKYISNNRQDLIDYDASFIVKYILEYIDSSEILYYRVKYVENHRVGIIIKGDKIIEFNNLQIVDELVDYLNNHNIALSHNKVLKKEK